MLTPSAKMRTILFLDDWAVLARQGIDRRWFPAEPWPGLEPWRDQSLVYQSVSAVLYEPQLAGWRMCGWGMTTRDKGDEGFGICAYRSTDGFDWQPLRQHPLIDKNATPQAAHIIFSGEFSGGGAVYYDPREPDQARRYKLPYSDL